MAASTSIVYENVTKDAEPKTGHLFQGRKFWVALRVPHRNALLQLITANGGHIVQLEKQADWMIADHFRKYCPPGTISYEFVHKSIAKGEILDPNDFPAGPSIGTPRDPGSLVRPAKGARNAYTPEDDRILYNWVKDAAAAGLAVSGNELYKQLEQKNSHHTWQSWRDRYLKQLRTRPSSALNIPGNAQPSPPSDEASRAVEAPAERKTALVKSKDKPQTVADSGTRTSLGAATSKPPAASNDDYSVNQLAATFTTEDWEDLYAFVEQIDSCSEDLVSYQTSWADWAESRDNQTAAQWQQYYEKIVRPQWLRDPVSKRERVRKRVEERHQDDSSSPTKSQSWSQTQDKAVGASQTEPALGEPLERTASNTLPSDSRLESELTAQHETPNYIRDGYESAVKRIRGETDDVPEATESVRLTKMRKISLSPTPIKMEDSVDMGAEEQPRKISSSRQTSAEPQLPEEVTQEVDEADDAKNMNDAESLVSQDKFSQIPRIPPPLVVLEDEDNDSHSIASSTDYGHIAPLPRPLQVPETEEDEDNLSSNAPTPRASKFGAFDTQAILSSPSQLATRISNLPRPPLDSSPPHHPDSDASTTQSIEEFSRSLIEAEPPMQTQPPLPRPASPTQSTTSSTTSETSSTDSGDPDEPLQADEIDDFFASQHAAGFSAEFITKALKRTRFRPHLAIAVLDAWKHGRPLPSRRGIWSVEDDELVEHGDGLSIEALEKKHSLDGWGGITERINWLRAWRQ